MKAALFLIASCLALAEPPPAVTELLRQTADAMANGAPSEVLNHFDSAMPNYAELAQRINALVAPEGAASTIDIVKDEGDDNKRKLELNWLLQVGAERQKRGKITVTVERQKGTWKFTSIDPVAFFAIP